MISTRCVSFSKASATSSGGVSILVLVFVSPGAASMAFWAVAAGGGQPVFARADAC